MPKGPFSQAEFVPTEWSTATEKAAFGNTLLHFLDAGCPRELFTKTFYTRLSMTFGSRHGFWNLSDDGRVCTGSMRRPDHATVSAIPEWERGFYESAFTHANVGRLTRHAGGFEGLWTELADKKKLFPVATLICLPQTLAQFVRGTSR